MNLDDLVRPHFHPDVDHAIAGPADQTLQRPSDPFHYVTGLIRFIVDSLEASQLDGDVRCMHSMTDVDGVEFTIVIATGPHARTLVELVKSGSNRIVVPK